MAVFVWSIYNGATYYIDVFGKRFQSELEQLKKDVAKWQTSPATLAEDSGMGTAQSGHLSMATLDQSPQLDSNQARETSKDIRAVDVGEDRKSQ